MKLKMGNSKKSAAPAKKKVVGFTRRKIDSSVERKEVYASKSLKIDIGTSITQAYFPKMTLTEEKFLAFILANIRLSDNGLPEYYCKDINFLAKKVFDMRGENLYRALNSAVDKMLDAHIELDMVALNMCRGENVDKAKMVLSLFSKFVVKHFDDGHSEFMCRLHEDLRPYLINLKGGYTEILLEFVLRSESVYTVRLNRLLMGSIPEKEGVRHVIYDIAGLARKMSLPPSYARAFSEFDRRALSRAVEEINRSSSEISILSYGKQVANRNIEGSVSCIWFDVARTDLGKYHIDDVAARALYKQDYIERNRQGLEVKLQEVEKKEKAALKAEKKNASIKVKRSHDAKKGKAVKGLKMKKK